MADPAVLGIGSTRFGAFHGERSAKALGTEAVRAALADADLKPAEIDAAYVSYSLIGVLGGQESMLGQIVLEDSGLVGLPVTRVESACASGSSAVREAVLAIEAGAARRVLVLGVEVMTSAPTPKVISALAGAGDLDLEGSIGQTFPAHFAMVAQLHMREFGTSLEQIAAVAVKNHEHGLLNPKAQFQRPISVEQVIGAKRVADPLGVLDCCPVSDGAAAVVIGAGAAAEPGDVRIRACELASGTYESERPLTTFDATRRAAATAFARAGVGVEDVDLFEVHDCFTIAELVHCEDLGLCARGEGGDLVESGRTRLGGESPVNVSGGLKAKGHPVGATGVGQIVELTQQLRGDAGSRQVEGARVGLAHCMGGFLHGDCGSMAVTVLAR
ncbi:MAG: beta-ketoacyl synthase N-terminal-like domain-containing protein [Solirubrobacterales bacterium]